jgi:thiol:disulfide interchange protein DsbA
MTALRLFALSAILLALLGCDQKPVAKTADAFVEGVHFRTLDQPISHSGAAITVSEFFWYGCSHCENFEPILQRWSDRQGADVRVERIPAVWSEMMQLHARIHFVTSRLNLLKPLHPLLFEPIMALRGEKSIAKQRQQLAGLFAQHGVNAVRFNAELDAPETDQQLQRAMAAMATAKINSTPTLMVNGRYVVISRSADSPEQLMAIVDYLVALERPLS